MKYSFLTVLVLVCTFMSDASSYSKHDDSMNIENSKQMANGKIKIKVGSKTFIATLLDNNSAKAFKEMLPLTLNMTELNGNEKYYDLPKSLPTHASNYGTVSNGDLMLYGSKTLVLFYKTFSTAYGYTKLGSVNDVTGFANALGSGNVSVTFEIN